MLVQVVVVSVMTSAGVTVVAEITEIRQLEKFKID